MTPESPAETECGNSPRHLDEVPAGAGVKSWDCRSRPDLKTGRTRVRSSKEEKKSDADCDATYDVFE